MIYNFDNYFEWLMPWEGEKYENVPGDPGGPTKFGIDQRSHPTVNIRNLTRNQAKEIYRREYWAQVAGDQLPGRIAWALMDIDVNGGDEIGWLQEIVGTKVDRRLGPITIAAAKKANDKEVAKALLDRRERYYRSLGAKPNFKKFLKGWLNRNNSLRNILSV